MDPYSWLCAASLFFTVISDGSRFETKCRQSSITYRHNHRVTDVRRVPPLNKTDSSRCDLYAGLGQIALKCQFLLLKKKKNTNQLDYKKKGRLIWILLDFFWDVECNHFIVATGLVQNQVHEETSTEPRTSTPSSTCDCELEHHPNPCSPIQFVVNWNRTLKSTDITRSSVKHQ